MPHFKDRRRFLQKSSALLGTAALSPWMRAEEAATPSSGGNATSPGGEQLHNGIVLPKEWPPRYTTVPTREPMMVPYLHYIPDIIPIDVGRQLFIDDYLIEPSRLTRRYHCAKYGSENPIVVADKPWESEAVEKEVPAARAMPFSDGVWYDPKDRTLKMWYMGGVDRYTCHATSTDGVHWTKPSLDVVPGTNIVSTFGRDSTVVWLDLFESNPRQRYTMFACHRPENTRQQSLFFSPDGIHSTGPGGKSGPTGDRCTAFYNPFRKVWVYSIKATTSRLYGRRRWYREHPDVVEGLKWSMGEPLQWVGADWLDKPRPEYGVNPELYNLDAVAYESILLGLFAIWTGEGGNGRPKPNQLFVAFSRDGFHWHRPNREPFIPVSEDPKSWNYGNVQSNGGCCVIMGDRLLFYTSGRQGMPGSKEPGVCATGLATLRRDGFASMDAGREEEFVTTRLLRFGGQYLFVNVEAPEGELRVEALDAEYKPIEPYTRENSVPIRVDSTRYQVCWKKSTDVARLSNTPMRFRFHLRNASLYSFWVSPSESGASNGYLAAG